MKSMSLAEMDKQDRKAAVKEARILEVMHHPNIVGFKEVYKTKRNELCIIMEYCDAGDLESAVQKRAEDSQKSGKWHYFSEDEILHHFTQICLGVKHHHDRKVLHRDLKADNIFMTKKGILKIGDFGVSSILNQTDAKAESTAGTPYYIAPELYLE